MKKLPPQTIADLSIDWKFERIKGYYSILKLNKLFNTLNPHLKNIRIIRNQYLIILPDLYEYKSSFMFNDNSISTFFENINWRMVCNNANSENFGTFSHFSKVNDTTFKLHLK